MSATTGCRGSPSACSVEPGDAAAGPPGGRAGRRAALRRLLPSRDPTACGRLAARLAEIEPERDLERAAGAASAGSSRATRSGRRRLDDLDEAEPLQELGGVPLGLWVRGPLRLDELTGPWRWSAPGRPRPTAPTWRPRSPPGWRGPGATVVSGAAFGIDQAAHRGALAVDGPTVAVLACGVDRAYPAAHQQLLDHLAEHGAIVSEMAPGCAPMRLRFLSRNRVIAALSRGTVVVEAAVRSGALNTASWAARLNRS